MPIILPLESLTKIMNHIQEHFLEDLTLCITKGDIVEFHLKDLTAKANPLLMWLNYFPNIIHE